MARPRARTRAARRRSEMNGFSRAIVVGAAPPPGDPLLLLVLLGLFLLRGPLVVVPDVFVLVRAALDAVRTVALQVEGLAAGPLRVVDQEVVVAVLGDRLEV